MPEFLKLHAPDRARELLLENIQSPLPGSIIVPTEQALGFVCAEDVHAPHPLPAFDRSSMDGYAVRACDTFGATDTLPSYLIVIGEVSMGHPPSFMISGGQCALIHTGGMLPDGADAVVMLEHTQVTKKDGAGFAREIEILRAVAAGENIIRIGEDVTEGQVVLPRGRRLRPAEIGGLMALGILDVCVGKKPRVALISTGDEIIPADQQIRPGVVRDINSHTLAQLIEQSGGEAIRYGIIPDQPDLLRASAVQAVQQCDALIITAGSSASTRDMTAEVIAGLGPPGVLVHGINTRPGKPTILGACQGKAVIGLPGNPVSALVNGYLFLVPLIEALLGLTRTAPPSVLARLTLNIPSQAGREDWWPVRLHPLSIGVAVSSPEIVRGESFVTHAAEPIFSKSNLIFSLVAADGLIKIPENATGLNAGEIAEVMLL